MLRGCSANVVCWDFHLAHHVRQAKSWLARWETTRRFEKLSENVNRPPIGNHLGMAKREYVCTNLFGLTYPLVYVLKCQATGPPAHREQGSAQRSLPLHNAPMTGRAATRHC
jgi:hypothetical protein